MGRHHTPNNSYSLASYSQGMQRLAHAQLCSSPTTPSLPRAPTTPPVASLPVELLRDVFRYTCPADQNEVIVLTSVCTTWRAAASSVPALFIAANWNAWPVPVLRAWCHRAGQEGLEVLLTPEGIHRAVSDDEFAGLVVSTIPRWQELYMDFDDSDEPGNARDVHMLLSRWKCPRLRTLVLSEFDNEGQSGIFTLPDDFAPNLAELMLKDVHVIRATPWEKLGRISVNVDFWECGTKGVDVFRTLSRTDKLIFHGCSFSGIGNSDLTLDGVNELVIANDSIAGFTEWPLRHLSFPHVTKLVLCGSKPYAIEFLDRDKALWNKAFPSVTSLQLQLL